MISKQDLVRASYRAILGREPENDAVVEAAALSLDTPEAVLTHFLSSSEHREKQGTPAYLGIIGRGQLQQRADIETTVRPDVIEALFERLRRQWMALGESDPYWSVLTQDRYRRDRIEEHRAEFEASGQFTHQLLLNAVSRAGVAMPKGCCVELGCGVGRVTRYLSADFESVIGLDVAAGNLRICRDYLSSNAITNVETRLLETVADLDALPEFDMLYSMIVLQHNPPPVMKHVLDTLLAKIRSGGMAYFQVPTHTMDYGFRAADYLASDPAELDMHALPMPEVFASLTAAGLEVREVLADGWTGRYGSHTFLAVKR